MRALATSQLLSAGHFSLVLIWIDKPGDVKAAVSDVESFQEKSCQWKGCWLAEVLKSLQFCFIFNGTPRSKCSG